jgi:hypothetical protein
MAEKINENIKKSDLDVILEVNRKAIEIETEAVEQNEDIIEALYELKNTQDKCLENLRILSEIKTDQTTISKKIEETQRDMFKLQALFAAGVISLFIQVVQLFLKK